MATALRDVFENNSKKNKATFVAYTTCGYPTVEDTVSILLGLQAGGAGLLHQFPY